jgi:hypothetical protein
MPLFSYGGKLVFRTNLSVAEIIGKMITFADKESGDFGFLRAYGNNEVVYNSEGDIFRLWRKPQYFGNGFMPFFYGQFEKTDGQTIIIGNFGMHPIMGFVSKFMLWVGIGLSLLFLLIYYLVQSRQAQVTGEMSFFFVLIPIGFTLVIATALRFCVWIGEKDVAVITDFIIGRFLANPEIYSLKTIASGSR